MEWLLLVCLNANQIFSEVFLRFLMQWAMWHSWQVFFKKKKTEGTPPPKKKRKKKKRSGIVVLCTTPSFSLSFLASRI